LGIIFSSVYVFDIPFATAWRVTGLLLLSIIGTAAYGYLLNNIFDLKEDKRAGKSNSTEKMAGWAKAAFVLIFLLMAVIPWLFLPVAFLNFGLFVLQLVLLAAYSIPPLRLKRFVHLGVIADALYNSPIMVFVIIFTMRGYSEISPENGTLILIVLFVALFLKGLRGILLHQIADRKNDQKTSITTFANKFGPLKTVNLVARYFVTLEGILLIVLILFLSINTFRFLWLVIPLFSIHLFFRFRLWERATLRKRGLKFSFLHVLNDFYEEWLPFVFLLYLIKREHTFVILLLLHIVLFYPVFSKMIKKSLKDLKNSRDYYYYLREYLYFKIIRRPVNET
jgi:4-hydroxybenzoate polyprenyltransferase